MNRVMSALRKYFSGPDEQPYTSTVAKVDAAISAANDVAEQSRAVNTKLQTYLDKRDPFMALLIDISNERAARAQIAQWKDD